jgi:hypothetical protein
MSTLRRLLARPGLAVVILGRARPPGSVRGAAFALGRERLRVRGLRRHEVGHSAPGEPRHQRRGLPRGRRAARAVGAQASGRSGLGHRRQGRREHLRRPARDTGDVGQHRLEPPGDRLGGALDAGPDLEVVPDVRLEQQRRRLARAVHEVEVGAHHAGDDGPGVVRPDLAGRVHRDRRVHGGQQLVAARVHHRQVEVELGREVPVEHRLADLGAVRDVVHRHVVEALGGEQLLRDRQHLRATDRAGHAHRTAVAGRGVVHRAMIASASLRAGGAPVSVACDGIGP